MLRDIKIIVRHCDSPETVNKSQRSFQSEQQSHTESHSTMKSIVAAFLLTCLVALAHSQDNSKATCASTLCAEGTECRENPPRCLQPCNKCVSCPKNQICIGGRCDKKPPLTCASYDCRRPEYSCRQFPTRCVKSCSDDNPCTDPSRICSKGFCEEASRTCAVAKCRSGYDCLVEPVRCVKKCKSTKECPRGTICCEGHCENSPTESCANQ